MKLRRADALAVLVLAAAPVVAHAPAWLEGRLLAPGEGAALHLPLRVEAWRSWSRGELPSWNPSVFSGTPLLASYRPGVLHPLMVALAPLPPLVAFQALVLVSLALAGPLLFLYARRLGTGPLGAFLCGLGFALGPQLVTQLGDTAMVVAAPTLPLVLLAAERILARGGAGGLALLAVAVALLLLAGSPGAALAGGLVLAGRLAIAALQPERPPRARAAWVLAGIATGAALAAPQLVPTWIAWREAAAGASDPTPTALSGMAGLVVNTVSHTPVPVFALAAVPLLPTWPWLRPLALVVFAALVAAAARGQLEGGLALALNVALVLAAGTSLDAQWRSRREPRGRRLRLLGLIVALCAAASLSVATTVTGPLAATLAAPVGLLALSLILYFTLAGAETRVKAGVFVLPLLASFLMQPWGRQCWEGAPTVASLERSTPTRDAIDRAMGERRDERTLTLSESRPRLQDDLAWANLATFAGRRNANGRDPLVPASRLAVFDGMGKDGTVSRRQLETDPGRLEFLGVRWLQIPTAELARPADANELGDALDVIVEGPRPHLFALPIARVSEVRIVSFLSGAAAVPQGEIVAECVARLASGHEIWLPIRAGVETAEWALERPDVRAVARHGKADVFASFPVRDGFLGHQYRGVLRLPGRFLVQSLRFRALEGAPPLFLLRAGVRDAETGRALGVSLLSAHASDLVRIAPLSQTPNVSLFEVRRGIGPAWVVPAVRRLPDRERVLDVLRSPTRQRERRRPGATRRRRRSRARAAAAWSCAPRARACSCSRKATTRAGRPGSTGARHACSG